MKFRAISRLTGFRFAAFMLFVIAGSGVSAQSSKQGAVHIGLLYPVSTKGVAAGQSVNRFSLHFFGGVSCQELAFSAAGFTNVVLDKVSGVQLAGFSNHVRNEVNGVQLAGFLNTAGSVQGAQLAGFTNITKGAAGSQLGGFINIAADVRGSQFAGFVNIARKVSGVQFAGFLNIADSSDYPVGLINLVKKGEKSIGVGSDEQASTLLSFRSGGRVLYGIVGAGYNFKNENAVYVFEAGFGAHLALSKRWRIDWEAVAINYEDFKEAETQKFAVRMLPSLKLAPRISLVAGPTFNFVSSNTAEGKNSASHYLWQQIKNNRFYGMHFGYMGGLQVRL